ncbi:hypothetical protein [Sphaerisporangium corydalis]|uniref:Uncharacterized protein n=1 Tax=Sphaerisporangium corydalis TaxID=1441875 RepID=A0ABV9E5Z4_9ACTN|nr:hypothetical protein [Sphaerisporangium corydalis]
MLENLVAVHLFRLQDVFHMSRARSAPRVAEGELSAPAMLVIPRGGPLREPHLMIFTGVRSFCAIPSGTLITEGAHVVVHLDDGLDEGWCRVADVVVAATRRAYPFPAHRVTRVLDRYPGCEVATSRRRNGCLAGLRDGRFAKITEVSGSVTAAGPGPAVYGSFLYGWLVAGVPLECLTTASVVLGRYVGSAPGGSGSLEVAGRAEITLTHPSLRSVRKRMS